MWEISILIAVYLLSVFSGYMWVKKAYSKGGIYSTIDVEYDLVIVTFLPCINTLFILVGWTFAYPIERNKDKKNKVDNLNNFFRIKK
jgi:hypothetical protein